MSRQKSVQPDLTDVLAFAAALPNRGALIGIDAGTKTLGLALSDQTRMIASALETIRRQKLTLDLAHLLPLAETHTVCGFVIGYPINLDGSKGPRAQATISFARSLAAVSPRPILLWDERWSTVTAERALIEGDTSRAKRADKIDMVAAVIILQGALERLTRLEQGPNQPGSNAN
jgi:putative holliday junction resolvase